MEGQKFRFPKIPAKGCLDGRLWAQFCRFFFGTFRFSGGNKSRRDLGQHLLENFSSRSWVRCGMISGATRTTLDEINDSVVSSDCGELVRCSDLPLVYSAHSTAGDTWRAPIRLLLKTHLEAGV